MTHEIIYEDPKPVPIKEVVLRMTPGEFWRLRASFSAGKKSTKDAGEILNRVESAMNAAAEEVLYETRNRL